MSSLKRGGLSLFLLLPSFHLQPRHKIEKQEYAATTRSEIGGPKLPSLDFWRGRTGIPLPYSCCAVSTGVRRVKPKSPSITDESTHLPQELHTCSKKKRNKCTCIYTSCVKVFAFVLIHWPQYRMKSTFWIFFPYSFSSLRFTLCILISLSIGKANFLIKDLGGGKCKRTTNTMHSTSPQENHLFKFLTAT